jgi:hypothetical protein
MGTVWRASDTLLRREVAVKEVVCPSGMAPSDRDAMYERTLREARAAAALSHPSVVQVYDVVTEDGRPWIVMELLDARSLADIVIEDGPLAPRHVAKIGIALLGALEVAHAGGVLHRDVKPANVLICSDGRCVLTDFGVARMPTDVQLTTPGMVLGSPHFISPERAMGGAFGPPSDLFSLGVSLYTAVEGRPPFDRGDPIETMHAVVEDAPAPTLRAGPLAGVLMGLLEKDPARRWDVTAARGVLRDLLAGPLANKARDHVTDPYRVVPVPPATVPPAVVTTPAQNGQIGGRAMLAEGESLEEAIARTLRAPAAPSRPATDVPTGEWKPAAHQAGPWVDSGTAWVQPGGRTYGGHRSGRTGAGGGFLDRVRSWPRGLQVAAAGGLTAVLVISLVLLLRPTGGGQDPLAGGGGSTPTAGASTPAGPAIEVQEHTQGKVTVNVPAGWTKGTPARTYTDFTDPDLDGRKVRILIESYNTTPTKFLESAERNTLKKASNCPAPYTRINLREVTMLDQQAAELEYTCGEGPQRRHGIWRALNVDEKAYSFFLTAPDNVFEESRKFFDEMVRSYRLTA